MGLEPVGKYVKIEIEQQPNVTAGGILLPEDRQKKSLYGVVMEDYDRTINDIHYVFTAGRKVFWAFGPVGAKYMNEDGKELVFMPPEEIFAVERK